MKLDKKGKVTVVVTDAIVAGKLNEISCLTTIEHREVVQNAMQSIEHLLKNIYAATHSELRNKNAA